MKIEIFHDLACPWCRIGKRNLELALADWDGEPVQVQYRSFFLNPNIPAEGKAFRPFMQAKGGGQVPLEGFFAAPRERGTEVGLAFNFEQIEKAPNTMLSHRLIALAPAKKKAEIVEAIYAAYFQHGRDIGDIDVLLQIAAEHGLDTDSLREKLEGEAGREQVLADANWARQQGIGGVPFFIVDGRYAFSGAQPPHLIKQVLEKAAFEMASG